MTAVDLDGFSESNGQVRWVGPPRNYPEEDSSDPNRSFLGAGLQCVPYFQDWSTIDLLYVFGGEIMPSSEYQVDAIHVDCADRMEFPDSYTTPLAVATGKWGDGVALFDGDDPGVPQPDFIDISAVVAKFTQSPTAPIKAHTQLLPNVVFPDRSVDFRDISAAVSSFSGTPYSETLGVLGPCTCPSLVPCGVTACVNDTQCGEGFCVDEFCTDACGRCTP